MIERRKGETMEENTEKDRDRIEDAEIEKYVDGRSIQEKTWKGDDGHRDGHHQEKHVYIVPMRFLDSPTEPRTTEARMGLLSEWTQPRMRLNPDWTQPRMHFTPNGT